MDKSLHIPFIPDLDFLNTDVIFSRLESQGERHTVESRNWSEEFPYHPLTTFTVAHSSKFIYVDFFVRCNYLRAVNYANNTSVHDDSCVQIYLQPQNADGRYWNFEFNCIGTVNAAHRIPGGEPTPLTDDEIATISRYASCVTRPFEEIEGLFTWNLLAAIPIELMGMKYEGHPIQMKGNVYKCASGTSQPHFLSWSPVLTQRPDFHRPEFFAPITID